MAFDPNKYKAIFDQRYGSGSFDSGLSQARQIGQLKVQADVAKRDYTERIRVERAAQKAKAKADLKKTYNDATAYWNDPVNKASLQKDGAYRAANKIRNDPNAKAAIKAQGYNVSDYINGMYNAASNGKFKSEREYNQFTSGFKKEQSNFKKSHDGMAEGEYKALNFVGDSAQVKPEPKKTSLFDKLKKSEVGKTATAAKQFFNPFDDVKAKDAVNNFLQHKQSDTFKGVARGANRAVDSFSLTAMSNLDKKINKREPYYNSERKFGQGGGIDMLTSGLGYLVPGIGAAKVVRGLGLGAKEATGLAKFGQLAKEGAITGGALTGAEVGIREALNPKDQNWRQNLSDVGLGVGLGAIGDPALHGIGKAVLKLRGAGKSVKEIATETKLPEEQVKQVVNGIGLERLKKPQFEKITSMKGNGGALKRVDSLPPNPFDHPFKIGDPLPNTKAHIQSKTKLDKPNLSTLSNKAYIKNVDNLHRLNQFDKEVESVLGRQLKPSESSYMLGLNSRGSDMISKQILTQNMVNKNGEAIGQSLKDITMKIPNGKLADFEDYLVNKHAITRMERGEKVYPDKMQMSPDKSRAKVAEYEVTHPEFKELSNQYYEYNNQLGKQWLVDTGILTTDQWEGYLKANPHYVPNKRIFKDIERPVFGNNAKKGFAGQTNPIKKAVGSQRPIVSPIESTIEHTAQYVKTAKRNEVMQSLINNIKQNPKAFEGWAEIVPTDKTPQSVMDTLQKEGIEGVLENFNKVFEQKPDLTKGNVVTGIIDGQKVHVKVHDPQLLEALTNLTPKAQHIIIHSLGQVTRVMKNLTTGINPVFSLTRNIFRDIPTAFTNSKTTNNPITFSKDLVSAVISVMKNDELNRSFKAIGGGHASPVSTDVNLLAQSKRSILPQKGLKSLFGKGLGALENLNNAVEAAPRLAEFKRITKNDKSFDAKMKGLFEANDVTVNFNKFGNLAKEIDSVIPYFNAAVQGIDKFGRIFLSKSATPAQKAVAGTKAFAAITIPSILLYSINHDNPNYQKLSNYIKDTNLLIPKADGTFRKIPKPRELGVIFGSDVERTLRLWADKDPEAFKDFTTTIWDNFKPPVRTIAAPFFDIRANKNFMDAPIVPGDLQGLSPQFQYDSKTSEIAKGLGKLMNASPKNIDYLMKSYGGVLGELGIPATTKDNGVGPLGRIGQTLKQKVTADPVFSNDLQRDFYNKKTKLDQAHYDLTKQGVHTKNLNEDLRKIFNKKSRQMGDIRKLMKKTQNDGTGSSKEKQRKLRLLQEEINKIAESANRQVR